jgi:hypothetical protein
MTSEDFQNLRASFEQLLAAPVEQRESLLQQLSQRDAVQAAELSKMLAAHRKNSSVLDRQVLLPGESEESAQVGSEIGPYNLERELGRGGMGVVYLATRADGSFEKRVAIKILLNGRGDQLFLDRFHRERQILAQLDHPHIAALLDAGTTTAGEPYFVMEYVEGVPITSYCKTHGLTQRQKLTLFLQVSDAVQYAHRNLTVHRDLKPGNILVTSAGAVKLLDFGIAKLLSQDQPSAQTEVCATAVILTPDYTSPEQIRRQTITTAADVFALGILLYELMSGSHPFRKSGQLPHEVMHAICEDDPASPATGASELDTIILTALRKQPSWRYPSVEQFADDVQRYLRGWPVMAQGNSAVYRLRKFVTRQWLPLSAAGLVVALLVAGIVVTTQQARLAEQESAEADRQRLRAEQAQQIATTQRTLAEQRTHEADAERQKERQRYRDVRSLASSLLFDLHDGIRDLAGSATARRLIVSKAQRQLEILSADSENDLDLQRDLAAAYERMGELRVNPRQPNKNDGAAALADYRHAVDLRRKIASLPSAQARDRRDLALSLSKMGDGHFWAGDTKLSVETDQRAWALAQTLVRAQVSDPTMLRALGAIDERRCIVLLAAGNNAGALDACREGIDTLSPLAEAAPEDIDLQRLIASTQGSYANALRFSKQPLEAVVQAKLALESLRRLESLAPSNAEYRRLSSSAETILAVSLAATGDNSASTAAFRRAVHSMEVAIEIDPSDLGSPLRLAVTLMAFSRRLVAAGDRTGGHDTAVEALQLLDQTSQKPGAGPVEWNEYADALLKVDWPDLQLPAKALQLARNAVSATNRKNPFFMDTLAWALYRAGDAAKAAETEREALGLLPQDAKGGLHEELDRGLTTFIAGTPKKL